MGIFSKLFSRKDEDKKVGGMEDYMTLVRVYFQAALASQLGITNLAMLPDLRVFKTSLHVPTSQQPVWASARRLQVKKMMKNLYDTDDNFFKEIDASIRKNCQKLQDVECLSHPVPELHPGSDDAHGQPDEVQAPSAKLHEEDPL